MKTDSQDIGVVTMVKKGVDKKGGSDVEKSRGKEGVIDWNAVICEGTDDITVGGKKEGSENKNEGEKEGGEKEKVKESEENGVDEDGEEEEGDGRKVYFFRG